MTPRKPRAKKKAKQSRSELAVRAQCSHRPCRIFPSLVRGGKPICPKHAAITDCLAKRSLPTRKPDRGEVRRTFAVESEPATVKKSLTVPAKAVGMKAFAPWTKSPPVEIFAVFSADRLQHTSTEKSFAQDAANESALHGRPAVVHRYQLATDDAETKLAEVRKYCESIIRDKFEVRSARWNLAHHLLAILNGSNP